MDGTDQAKQEEDFSHHPASQNIEIEVEEQDEEENNLLSGSSGSDQSSSKNQVISGAPTPQVSPSKHSELSASTSESGTATVVLLSPTINAVGDSDFESFKKIVANYELDFETTHKINSLMLQEPYYLTKITNMMIAFSKKLQAQSQEISLAPPMTFSPGAASVNSIGSKGSKSSKNTENIKEYLEARQSGAANPGINLNIA